MKKITVRKQGGKPSSPLTHTDTKSVTQGKGSKSKASPVSNSISIPRRGVKRVIRNKTSQNSTKTKKKVNKIVPSKKRAIKVEALSESEDSQANKENDAPTSMPIKKRGRKKGSLNKSSHEKPKVQQNIIDYPLTTPNSKVARQVNKRVYESAGDSIKEEKDGGQTPSLKASSTKRVSLRKKTESIAASSACKQEYVPCETPKQEPDSDIKGSPFEQPKSGYGLRKRGRQPKKSKIYQDEDNIIFSHEKDEDMNKIDDSEFKLPNEERSKKFINP